MRFLSMIRIDEKTAKPPTERLMNEMGQLIEDWTRSGVLVSTAGLRPTSEGARVRLRGGKLSTVDGPFTETKELLAGYWLIQAKSKEEAIQYTRRFLELHGDEWEIDCELRQMEGPDC